MLVFGDIGIAAQDIARILAVLSSQRLCLLLLLLFVLIFVVVVVVPKLVVVLLKRLDLRLVDDRCCRQDVFTTLFLLVQVLTLLQYCVVLRCVVVWCGLFVVVSRPFMPKQALLGLVGTFGFASMCTEGTEAKLMQRW